MPFAAAADGARLSYEVIGSGPPLMLVSGQASDRSVWNAIRDEFAAHHRVIVFDHRGTGLSDKPEAPPYSTRGFANDAVAVLDAAGIRRAHIYGISMGGRIGQWLAIDHPARIGGLVLGCTTPGNAHGVRRPPAVDPELTSGDPVRLLPYLVTPGWAAAHPEALEGMQAVVRERPVPPYARQLHYQASEGHDAWDLLPTIKAPTLVVHGSDDLVNVPANAPLLAERIPGAVLHIIAGGRHAYFLENRPEASQVVLDFLARHPLDGSPARAR
jgi:pimeloyl-ACP methyl ester carboxylesterase